MGKTRNRKRNMRQTTSLQVVLLGERGPRGAAGSALAWHDEERFRSWKTWPLRHRTLDT